MPDGSEKTFPAEEVQNAAGMPIVKNLNVNKFREISFKLGKEEDLEASPRSTVKHLGEKNLSQKNWGSSTLYLEVCLYLWLFFFFGGGFSILTW